MAKKKLDELNEELSMYGKLLGQTKSEINKIAKLYETQADLAKKITQSASMQLKQQQTIAAIANNRVQATADLAKMHMTIKTGLTGEYAELAMQLEASKKLNKTTLEKLKRDQQQTDQLKKQKDYIKEIAAQQKKLADASTEYKRKLEGYITTAKAVFSSPAALAGAATVALKKIGDSFANAFRQMKSEGLSTTQAISEYLNSLGDGAILFSKEVREAQKGFRETGGTLSQAREFGKEAAQAAAKYGGSMEQAGKALGTFQKLPGMSKEAAIAANDFSGALAQAADVPADVVMKEVANNSEAVALSGAKNLQNLQKAVVNSAKMGVEFGKIVSLSRGLLDFESSINAQMEASVLLGREINLDKAREAALQGDYLGVQREILKNIGTEAEFNKMNTLQKEKLAQAMGVSVSDMTKMVKGQADQTDLAKEAAAQKGKEAGFMDQVVDFALKNAGALASSIPSLLLTTAQLFTQLSIMKSMSKLAGTSSGDKKGGIISKIKGMFGFGTSGTPTPPVQPAGGGPQQGPPGIDSVSKINVGNLIKGAAAMAIASVGIFIFAKAVQELAKVEAWDRVAKGLGLFVGSMLALGLIAQFLGAPLAGLSLVLVAFGAATLLMGAGVALAATGLTLFMKALTTVPINTLLAVGPAFVGIGLGILAVAGAAALIAPAAVGLGLFFGVLALGSATIALVAFSIEKMASSSKGLTEAGVALTSMGSGLASIAANGLSAMPVIGALIGLAAVAPALAKLGDVLGGGGGTEQDKMDTLIAEIRALKEVVSKPAAVTLDGRKVGDAIRLNINGTAIR